MDFIKGNFLELDREGFLDEERLRDNTGFLVGWISGQFIPEKMRTPVSTAVEQISVITRTTAFLDGLTQGRQGFYRAIKIGNQVKEDVIVDIVRNLIEIAVEGWLSEDLLRRDVVTIAGILTNCASMV